MLNMMPYRYNGMNRGAKENRGMTNPFLDDFFRPFFGGENLPGMKVDVEDQGDSYLLAAELPGVSRENVKVDIDGDVMTISAVMGNAQEDENRKYVYRERRYGSVSRSFQLEGVQKDGITAHFQDGVLHMVLPKETAAVDSVRHIEIA